MFSIPGYAAIIISLPDQGNHHRPAEPCHPGRTPEPAEAMGAASGFPYRTTGARPSLSKDSPD
jgi:hypothetical protein